MVRIDSKVYIAILVGIALMGIAYKPLILLLIPALAYRDFREWLIESLLSLAYPNLAPKLILGGDYVFDAKNSIMHVFYRAEPMPDISRLTGSQYVGLFDELIRRLNLGINEAVASLGLVVTGSLGFRGL